jgi:hypothetical protein
MTVCKIGSTTVNIRCHAVGRFFFEKYYEEVNFAGIFCCCSFANVHRWAEKMTVDDSRKEKYPPELSCDKSGGVGFQVWLSEFMLESAISSNHLISLCSLMMAVKRQATSDDDNKQ